MLCDVSRCVAARHQAETDAPPPLPPGVGDGLALGEVSEVLLNLFAGLGHEEEDPRFAMAALALKLASQFDRRATVQLAAAIERLVRAVTGFAGEGPTALDTIRASAYAKHASALMRAAALPVEEGRDVADQG